MNKKPYSVIVTDAYFVANDGVLDWATDIDPKHAPVSSKIVERHDTLENALKSMSEWGSRWIMYPGVIIEKKEYGEVYSDLPAVYRCKCCKKEEWERVVSDMRKMKGRNGKLLFPEIV